MSDKHDDDYDEKYTKPDLRWEIKQDLMESDKGGEPGEWSARKSQMLVQEYEKRGGGYKNDEKDEDAESLEEWTEQDWQTADGSAYADDGEKMKRYLPADAWDLLSDEEKEKAKERKQEGDEEGRQYVENTAAAKAARAYVDHGDASDLTEDQLKRLSKGNLAELASEHDIDGRSSMTKDELAEALRDHFDNAPGNMTKQELYDEAKDLDVDGRSSMDKSELADAVEDARN